MLERQGAGRILTISVRPAVSRGKNTAAFAVANGATITLAEAQGKELRDRGE